MLHNPLPAACRSYTTHRTDDASYPQDWTEYTLIKMRQPHGNNVEIVDSPHEPSLLNCDGIITTQSNIHLQVKSADCLPILIFHPLPIIAAIHAGRKSTQTKIATKTLGRLRDEFQVTDQIQIWFGPAICADCYQIDREKDLHYDLQAENMRQVRTIFSPSQAKITTTELCTAHHNDQFFSYRKEGPQVPMNYSGIVLDLPSS